MRHVGTFTGAGVADGESCGDHLTVADLQIAAGKSRAPARSSEMSPLMR
jgi:hypothetical protein